MTSRPSLLRLFVSLVAIAAFFLGLGGCISYLRLGSIAGRAVLIAPYFSAAAMLCGVLLYAARAFPRRARWYALAAIGAILFANLPPERLDAWVNGPSIFESFVTALIIVGASAAFFLHGSSERSSFLIPRTEIAIAFLGIPTSIFLAFAFMDEGVVTRQKYAQASANVVAQDIADRTARAQAVIRRLSGRWGVLEGPLPPDLIDHELQALLNDFPFFLGVALVDGTGNILWERHRDQTSPGWFESLLSDSELYDTLQQTFARGETHTTAHEPELSGTRVSLIISPITGLENTGQARQAVVAAVGLKDIVAWAMQRADHYGHFKIQHEGTDLYQTTVAPPVRAVVSGTVAIPMSEDIVLRLSYLYAPLDTELDPELWAEFIWLAGLIFTFLLIASLRLTRIAQIHAARLDHNAMHDPVTELPNRRLLEERLAVACAKASSAKQPVSVVFISLTGIKLINDSVNHSAGDDVLREVAKRLLRSAGRDAMVTQIGSEEFTLLFYAMSPTQVEAQTAKIVADLSLPYSAGDRTFPVSVNAGIVNSDGNVTDAMELVQQADLAMLQARKAGHNTWETYSDSLITETKEWLELREGLHAAISNNGMELHYQPIVKGQTGHVIGVEGLLRWQHPTRGYISPARFISLAEETGQITAITDWTLKTACRHRTAMSKLGIPAFPVIINISPLYFLMPDFLERVQNVLNESGLPPEFLELEITENVFLGGEAPVIEKLTALREMGIKTSIDDFGTGYSSLSCLKTLPIDKIKIDRSFVTDVVTDSDNASIVQGIISMAHHLSLKVVAEGVETSAQFSFLMRHQCNFFQGYLFGRPMPVDELTTTLIQRGFHLLPPEPPPSA